MSGKIKATVKFSSFDYVGTFAEPVFEPLRVLAAITPVYRALKPWNVTPQDVKYRGGALNVTDPVATIELAKRHYTVSLGIMNLGFKANFVAWDQAPIIIDIIDSNTKTVAKELNISVAEHSLTIIMQAGVEGKSLQDLTAPFASPLGYFPREVNFFGFIVYGTDDFQVYVDRSANNPDDLFVRIIRKFTGSHDMNDMSKRLYEDEQRVARALGIETID